MMYAPRKPLPRLVRVTAADRVALLVLEMFLLRLDVEAAMARRFAEIDWKKNPANRDAQNGYARRWRKKNRAAVRRYPSRNRGKPRLVTFR